MTTPDRYYRVIDMNGVPVLFYFKIVKQTECGVFIEDGLKPRFILNDAKKRFAYPTITQAIYSFKRRKASQIKILTRQLQNVRDSVAHLENDGVETYGTPHGLQGSTNG